MAVEAVEKAGINTPKPQVDLPPGTILPPTLKEAINRGINPNIIEVSLSVTLSKKHNVTEVEATGVEAVYVAGPTFYHITSDKRVFWGTEKRMPRAGIWGLAASISSEPDTILNFFVARIPKDKIPQPKLSY